MYSVRLMSQWHEAMHESALVLLALNNSSWQLLFVYIRLRFDSAVDTTALQFRDHTFGACRSQARCMLW